MLEEKTTALRAVVEKVCSSVQGGSALSIVRSEKAFSLAAAAFDLPPVLLLHRVGERRVVLDSEGQKQAGRTAASASKGSRSV